MMEYLSTWPGYYIAGWVSFCVLGAVVIGLQWRDYEYFQARYWRFLLAPWRLAFFALGWVGIVALAPYTGDPTWDAIDASFMAILAYTTGPASVAILYRVGRGWRPPHHAVGALAVWLFSASWSYDLYLLLRDGNYPLTWAGNLYASSFLYLCAGGFWALDWQPGHERALPAFLHKEGWVPTPRPGAFRKVMRYAWVVLLPIILFFLAFPFLNYTGFRL